MDPETRAYLDEMRGEIGGEIREVRDEVRGLGTRVDALSGLRDEVRGVGAQVEALSGLPDKVSDLGARIDGLRGLPDEVRGLGVRIDALSGLPDEVRGLDVRIDALSGLPDEVRQLREEMRSAATETRRYFDVAVEAFRHDIQTGLRDAAANTAAGERLRSDIHREIDERFQIVNLAFADVRRDIAKLRKRRR